MESSTEQTKQEMQVPIQAEQLATETREFIKKVSEQLPQSRRVSFEPTLNEVTSRLEYAAVGRASEPQTSYSEADTLVKSMDGESLARHARHVWDQVKRELSSEQRAVGEQRIGPVIERIEFASIGSLGPTNAVQQQQLS